MSRCFPFPPPGYLRNSDALIEPIKLRMDLDMEKPKKHRTEEDKKERKERKKEKKEKKEKKREKKEKRKAEKEKKEKDSTVTHVSSGDNKSKPISEVKEPKVDGKLLKGDDCENEFFERSGITEELDQPVTSPQEPYSSDSSQSSKRKRVTLLPNNDHGPAIRIRLPLRKHREPEESKQVFQIGSSSRGVEIAASVTRNTSKIVCSERPLPCITKVQTDKLPVNSDSKVSKPLQKLVQANKLPGNSDSKVSKPLQKLVQGDTVAASKKVDDASQRMELFYNSFLQIPPLTYDGLGPLDQDWLFSSVPTESMPVSKKQKFDSDAFQCSKSLRPPRAQYMPDVGIYALPYTVPF
uniref:DNA ligase 1-like isoform X2 n=1 Tax=Cicer arietinum TaxID=3827 RepID=A0A1S3E740_CICAR|nr:DNA ligase 1-like isoform X2 [Cicer arietinum]